MKLGLLHILAFLVTSFGISLHAQTTAVMQVSVEVVSGAGFTSIEESVIDFSSPEFVSSKDVATGAFSLVTAPGTDVNIQVSNHTSIKNAEGEAIDFESISIDKTSNDRGEHQISLRGKVNKSQALQGQYQGDLTATIEYL